MYLQGRRLICNPNSIHRLIPSVGQRDCFFLTLSSIHATTKSRKNSISKLYQSDLKESSQTELVPAQIVCITFDLPPEIHYPELAEEALSVCMHTSRHTCTSCQSACKAISKGADKCQSRAILPV